MVRGGKMASDKTTARCRGGASFVWKPAHFEFWSYGSAWHKAKIAFVEKYSYTYLVVFAILRVNVLGKMLV